MRYAKFLGLGVVLLEAVLTSSGCSTRIRLSDADRVALNRVALVVVEYPPRLIVFHSPPMTEADRASIMTFLPLYDLTIPKEDRGRAFAFKTFLPTEENPIELVLVGHEIEAVFLDQDLSWEQKNSRVQALLTARGFDGYASILVIPQVARETGLWEGEGLFPKRSTCNIWLNLIVWSLSDDPKVIARWDRKSPQHRLDSPDFQKVFRETSIPFVEESMTLFYEEVMGSPNSGSR